MSFSSIASMLSAAQESGQPLYAVIAFGCTGERAAALCRHP